MDFTARTGCPMCGIVAKALHGAPNSPSTFSLQQQQGSSSKDSSAEILWHDDNFTVYRERAYPVSSKAHIVIVFNLHVPSLYTLSSSDVPLLVSLRNLAHRFLSGLAQPPNSPLPTPIPLGSASMSSSSTLVQQTPPLGSSQASPLDPQLAANFRVGFITPPFKDNCIPVKDHLHAHAYIAPNDLCGWWRRVAYGPLAWYSIDDLIAEIRESSSNNRIKSGHEGRSAPIDRVADAGARSGTADGLETTDAPLAANDVESRGEAPRNSLGIGAPGGSNYSRQGMGSRSASASSTMSGSDGVTTLLSPPPTAKGTYRSVTTNTSGVAVERRAGASSSSCSTPSPRTSMALYDQ